MANDKIWAPWRLAYIQSADRSPQCEEPFDLLPGADPQCFLCRAAAGCDDRGAGVVYRGQQVLAVLNRYPYNNGHLLVAPLAHAARFDQIDSTVQCELTQTIAPWSASWRRRFGPTGSTWV